MWGEQERLEGNYEAARDIQLQALEVARQTEEENRVAMLMLNLGLISHHLGDDEEAERFIREALDISIRIGVETMVAHCLIGIADQVSLRGSHRLGTRLVGAASAYFDSVGLKVQPGDKADHVRIEGSLRSHLGDIAYEEEMAAGARLDLNEAVGLAQES